MKKNILENIKLWAVPAIIALLLIFSFNPVVRFLPMWFVKTYSNSIGLHSIAKDSTTTNVSATGSTTSLNPMITGPIGDTYGGILGPVIAMIASFLTFLAFWIQYRANKQQDNYIKQQRFEDTFFRLLDHHKKNLDTIDIREGSNASIVKAIGSECFKLMYSAMKKNVENKTDFQTIDKAYDQVQNHFKHDLHHYFRFLYHIIKFIKHSPISEKEKYKYSSILRATLSAYELVFLFYNCLHEYGYSHFKPLLEEFSFLKNMDDSLLFNVEQKKEYHPLTFSTSSEREKIIKEWRQVQKDKAGA